MAQQEQTKYSYKFNLKAGRIGEITAPPGEEPERSELQAYINEVLGLENRKQDKNRIPY
jgi:hypothetical protein